MNNFPSPFAGLLLSDVADDADTPKSLLDLINSHSSLDQNVNDDATSLSDLTSKCLKVDDHLPCEESVAALSSCLGNLMIIGDATETQSDDCNTLEAYTKSFLNSKGTNLVSSRKPTPPSNFCRRLVKTQDSCKEVKQIDEKLQKIYIDKSLKTENRKIDFTAALEKRCRTTSTSSVPVEIPLQAKQSVFTYPVKECTIDLSSLADENLLYRSTFLSPFGYVISRKWNCVTLPKKYRKLERTRPYDIAKSFKFDTLSPDEYALKNRTRNYSSSET